VSPTVGYLDARAGVSGDMWLGALLDAGCPLDFLQSVPGALGLDGVTVEARRVRRGPLDAAKVDVLLPGTHPQEEGHGHAAHGSNEPGHGHVHGRAEASRHAVAAPPRTKAHAHAHRGLREVLAVVRGAKGLPVEALADATRTFTLLAEAEARVHGVTPDEVHFHEVGALDALVDVVGVCAGLRRLGVVEVRVSPLPWFQGEVETEHGRLSLPAPAVVRLLEGHPTFPSGESYEQVTPTGAALVRALSRGTAPPAGFVPRATGTGAGTHPGGRLPNVCRLTVGEHGAEASEAGDVVLLETNLDDATGQQVAHAIERALEAGALDAWAAPVAMKKGRLGTVLSVLAPPALARALEEVLFRETPTLGVRRATLSRTALPRRSVPVPTPYGPIHVKVRTAPGGDEATPEYEECRLAAERAGVPLREVQDAALAAWHASRA
jgi:uncharacterized protein (TIGR00299 family) protein